MSRGDVHLGDAEAGRDLRLVHAMLELQVQDHPLARRQVAEAVRQGHSLLHQRVPVLGRRQVDVAHALLVADAGEGPRPVRGARAQRVQDAVQVHARLLGDLGGARRPAQPAQQRLGGGVHGRPVVLQAARHPDRPRLVAEVAADLPEHRRRRERAEVDAAVRVEAVGGADQRDHAHLGQVLQRLAAVGVPAGERLHEADVVQDQLLALGVSAQGRWPRVRGSRHPACPRPRRVKRGRVLRSHRPPRRAFGPPSHGYRLAHFTPRG